MTVLHRLYEVFERALIESRTIAGIVVGVEIHGTPQGQRFTSDGSVVVWHSDTAIMDGFESGNLLGWSGQVP